MEFVAFPIGLASTTLTTTLTHLTTAFSTIRLQVEPTRASRGNNDPDTDHTARIHDYNLFKSLPHGPPTVPPHRHHHY